MQPTPDDTSINLPVTFDYRGGRGENVKGKVIVTIVTIVLQIVVIAGVSINEDFLLYQKVLYIACAFMLGLWVLRFFVFKELYFSDIYEGLLEKDFELSTEDIWQIFDIDYSYPYICYFKNGQKGIFVRMEKGVITGKSSNADYQHYEAISDAYNVAHALNMNIVHIDYMDNVGNDSRLQSLYNDLDNVENPDMQEMLIDMYSYIQEEMSRNYSCFDIYVFLTRDVSSNFIYNVQTVANVMLGGNYITYRVLDRPALSGVCSALFNLNDFSLVEACENVLSGNSHRGIIPISVMHSDGTVDIINKTQEEKRLIAEAEQRRQEELKKSQQKSGRRKSKEPDKVNLDKGLDDDLNLFG